ncbi:MAG: biotin/lipoyl-containing protein, partial [Rhodocyclaceae bacterium]|nr:biotin/lipoyl-containing protein [Rhodocyclaceae bacterium]
VEAGIDAVDGALDSLSGLTSQPNLTAIADALAGTERAPDVDTDAMRELSDYWEGVRRFYAPFEADIRSGTSDVYRHEMPGGQYTNLREQARAMGLEHRWPEVSRAYADVNRLFGDIVKVTPTSKVVGDMALFMVANDLAPDEVEDPARDVAFPESVVSLFKGELGRPPEGFPKALSDKILHGKAPLADRPGKGLAPVDLDAERAKAEKAVGRRLDDNDLASHLMYPKVFAEFAAHHSHYGNVDLLPTPVFFNGLAQGEEISVEIDPGKTLVIRLQGSADITDEEGEAKKLFFELNGQPRNIRVAKVGAGGVRRERPKAEEGNPDHVGAPMPGSVVTVSVKAGQKVRRGDPLVSIEAMKMETVVRADRDGTVAEVHAVPGMAVSPKDLLVRFG